MAEIVRMLALSPTMEEGLLVSWSKQVGDPISQGDVIAEIETDKATMELESFFDGTVLQLLVTAGSNVAINTPIAIIGEKGEDISALISGGSPSPAPASAPAAAAAPTTAAAAPAPAAAEGERRFVSPVARKIAQEHQLALGEIQGSGPRGRVIKRDVEAALAASVSDAAARAAAAAPAAAPVARVAPVAAPVEVTHFEGSRRVELTPMRKTIARRMAESWVAAPMFTLTTEVDMDDAVRLRTSLNKALEAGGVDVKLSFNDLVIKASALALRAVPGMNVAWGGDHVVQHEVVHIGVAVALEGGLVTPVVRHADKMSLGAISEAVRGLAARAREKKLKPEDYQGSTFSVSNLGMFGVTKFQAIINPPEAGILAVGALVKKPVVTAEGALAVGHRMEITLSCDHRSTDGAQGAAWLAEVRRLLENPILLAV